MKSARLIFPTNKGKRFFKFGANGGGCGGPRSHLYNWKRQTEMRPWNDTVTEKEGVGGAYLSEYFHVLSCLFLSIAVLLNLRCELGERNYIWACHIRFPRPSPRLNISVTSPSSSSAAGSSWAGLYLLMNGGRSPHTAGFQSRKSWQIHYSVSFSTGEALCRIVGVALRCLPKDSDRTFLLVLFWVDNWWSDYNYVYTFMSLSWHKAV